MVEVIWEGKLDASGAKIPPLRVALPLQTIETVNESTKERQRSLERFVAGREDSEWRNRLIWGDKKYVLPSLLPEFSGKVNLIYIDPPFDTGADFSFTARVPDDPNSLEEDSLVFNKKPSMIEQKAYRDTWGVSREAREKGVTHLDRYLKWFYETAVLLYELLAENGSIYVHVDEHADHYVRGILDEIFGTDSFRNELAWKSTSAHSDSRRYGSNHQTILFYTKGPDWTWNNPKMKFDQAYVDQYYRYKDPDGRRFKSGDLSAYGLQGAGYTYEWHGHRKLWRLPIETMQRLDKEGRIFYTKNDVARSKSYLDETDGMPAQTLWVDKAVQYVVSWGDEKLPYDTQKSEGLINRIVETSSNPGDLVLDCFVGSGTTAAVAEKLEKKRRWIACDLSRFAIHLTRKRLLSVQNVGPFVIQNLGKYERQAWQTAEFGIENGRKVRSYINFILKLYSAQHLNGYAWLHGKKRDRLVHVGSVDSPVSPLDVGQIVAEFKRSVGTGKDAPKTNGIDVLGWDFAFELNELAKQQAAQAGVDLRFMRIPREVLDKNAVEQGDVHFFELASLDLDLKISGKKAMIAIEDFVIPLDDVPTDIQKSVTHWSQWIDYWAIDWDNKNDTFHNEWQEYRTIEKPKLETESTRTYTERGDYRVVVKVIDILGNDTTKLMEVKIQ